MTGEDNSASIGVVDSTETHLGCIGSQSKDFEDIPNNEWFMHVHANDTLEQRLVTTYTPTVESGGCVVDVDCRTTHKYDARATVAI